MENLANKQEMLDEAINCLLKLKVNKKHIDKFKQDNLIPLFVNDVKYIPDDINLYEIVKKYEERTKNLVYAITYEHIDGYNMYSMLIVSKYKDDWNYLITNCSEGKDTKFVLSYVYNVDKPIFSEVGDVVIRTSNNNLRRID